MAGCGSEVPGGQNEEELSAVGLRLSTWRGKISNRGVGKSAVRPQLDSKSRPLLTTVLVVTGRKQETKSEPCGRKVGGLTPWALVKV